MTSDSYHISNTNRLDDIEIKDIDISTPERFQRNEHGLLFTRLRLEHPLHYCPNSPYGPYWSVTRFEDIVEVEKSHSIFSSEDNIIIGDVSKNFDATQAFATYDPPQHTKERRAISPAFTRKRLESIEQTLRNKIKSLFCDLPRQQPFDWVKHVSNVVTNSMVAELFDLEDTDKEMLPFWCEVLVTTPAVGALVESWQDREQIIKEYQNRLLELWVDRRYDDVRTDVITALARNPETSNFFMDPMRLVGTVSLIAGANEAARGALSGAVVAFNQFPEQWALLQANPTLINNAIAEIVRWQTPIIHMRRTTTQDTWLRDSFIPKGSKVIMWYCSGNKDESYFQKPEIFDITRTNANKHLGYGTGIHRCLGQHVAEMELRIVLEEMLNNSQKVDVVSEPERVLSNFSANYHRLLVKIVD